MSKQLKLTKIKTKFVDKNKLQTIIQFLTQKLNKILT